MNYTYEYPRPAATTDMIIVTREAPHKLLLIQRKNPPFQGQWALPGGFLDENETLETCAYRELKEETNIEGIILNQFKTYSEPGRDPRGRTISTVFWGTAPSKIAQTAEAADDAASLDWFALDNLPRLAFDHNQVLDEALETILSQYNEPK
ncbi:MAG: NUDIX hydrolase [Salinivirgaceae bacterium]|jgi:8-oxo-dGTP diphosphatase|nr:NUDIX hydrolase [Salinivirgaceae bacterium]